MSNDQTSMDITLDVNGGPRHVNPKSHSSLLGYLRTELRLTGTKQGCAMGNCGACTVLIDDTATQACQVTLSSVAGSEVKTVEDIVQSTLGKQITETLTRYDAAQCGYCLPGIVVAAYAEILNTKKPNAIDALQRNLCRCGTHARILNALQEVISKQDVKS